MTNNIKQFLEADALRTQGEWELNDFYNKQNHYKPFYINAKEWEALAEISGHMCTEYVDEARANANFIAAASRIAPDIRQLLAAFEQVCEALEALRDDIWDDKVCDDALTAAAPYRKQGGV